MDLNQDVWKGLRANGHSIGIPYVQDGAGLFVLVDGIAMSIAEAKAVAQKRATVAEIADARNSAQGR